MQLFFSVSKLFAFCPSGSLLKTIKAAGDLTPTSRRGGTRDYGGANRSPILKSSTGILPIQSKRGNRLEACSTFCERSILARSGAKGASAAMLITYLTH